MHCFGQTSAQMLTNNTTHFGNVYLTDNQIYIMAGEVSLLEVIEWLCTNVSERIDAEGDFNAYGEDWWISSHIFGWIVEFNNHRHVTEFKLRFL